MSRRGMYLAARRRYTKLVDVVRCRIINHMRGSLCVVMVAMFLGGCGAARPEASSAVEVIETVSLEAENVLVRRAPSSTGGLEGDVVGRALARQSSHFATCYQAAGGPQIGRGVVYLLLDVEAAGRIGRVTVGHSDIRSPRFESCLRDSLDELTLPEASGPSMVQAHLVFGTNDDDEGREMLRAYRATRVRDGNADMAAVPLSGLRRRVQSCYERAFRGRGMRGRMVLALTLTEDGSVSEAAVSEENLDGRLDRCVLGAVRNLRLEQQQASAATLLYPVILEPGR